MWHLALHRWAGDPTEAVETHLEAHLRWVRDQQFAGRILIAGPTPDRSLGIIVLAHMSEDEAHELCRTDPFVAGGFRTYELIPWDVHHAFGIGAFDPAAVAAMAREQLDATGPGT